MIKCTKCGREIHEEARFCPYCMEKCVKVRNSIEIPKKRKYIVYVLIGFMIMIVMSTVILIHKFDKNTMATDVDHIDSLEITSLTQSITAETSTMEGRTTEVPTTENFITDTPTIEAPTKDVSIMETSPIESLIPEISVTEETTTETLNQEPMTTENQTTEESTTETPNQDPMTTETSKIEDLTTEIPTTEVPTIREQEKESLTTTEISTTETPTTKEQEIETTEITAEQPTVEETDSNISEVPIILPPSTITVGTPVIASRLFEIKYGCMMNSESMSTTCKEVEIGIKNRGESTIRVFPDATINVVGSLEYDRNMKLINSNGTRIHYIDIPKESTVYVRFHVIGNETLFSTEKYGNITEVHFTFYYGNTIYNGIATAGVEGIKYTLQQ